MIAVAEIAQPKVQPVDVDDMLFVMSEVGTILPYYNVPKPVVDQIEAACSGRTLPYDTLVDFGDDIPDRLTIAQIIETDLSTLDDLSDIGVDEYDTDSPLIPWAGQLVKLYCTMLSISRIDADNTYVSFSFRKGITVHITTDENEEGIYIDLCGTPADVAIWDDLMNRVRSSLTK